MERYDILIIGAGAAGIAAAKAAYDAGCANILLVDRKKQMGGVLLQCAHHGFGQNLSGPEYTRMILEGFPEEIHWCPSTTVLSVSEDRTAQLCGPEVGRKTVSFQQLILATGCREIPIGAMAIGGTRPEGVYTAGQMQEMMNLHGYVPQGPAVILGSGDLGLVMAKQLAQLGIAVTLVEKQPHCGGMVRNRRCLREFPMKLICNATITEIQGQKRLEAVKIQNGITIPCKTLLIAAGLRPEREAIWGLRNPQWLRLCGNCSRIHPMVEGVINEGKQAGIAAWESIRGSL